MPAALTSRQRQDLARMYREAFALAQREAREAGAVLALDPRPSTLDSDPLYLNALLNDFDEWRHEQVARACNKAGLTCCSQDDYGAVLGQALKLLGRKEAAQHWQMRDAGNPKRVADYKLAEALRAGGFNPGYAESICRHQFHCAVADASAKQTWSLVYTIKNRGTGRARRSARAAATSGGDGARGAARPTTKGGS